MNTMQASISGHCRESVNACLQELAGRRYVGGVLQTIRKSRFLSVSQVSDELNLMPSHITSIEAGDYDPQIDYSAFEQFVRSYAHFADVNLALSYRAPQRGFSTTRVGVFLGACALLLAVTLPSVTGDDDAVGMMNLDTGVWNATLEPQNTPARIHQGVITSDRHAPDRHAPSAGSAPAVVSAPSELAVNTVEEPLASVEVSVKQLHLDQLQRADTTMGADADTETDTNMDIAVNMPADPVDVFIADLYRLAAK